MSNPAANEHILDNPVWHALRGPLSQFAALPSPQSGTSRSPLDLMRFDSEVSVFSAVERVDGSIWNDIAGHVGLEGYCGLFRDVVPAPPDGWEEQFRGACLQMVAGDLPSPAGLEVTQLGPDDAADMLALTALTEPGPFLSRTYELGRYIGVRRGGQLMAMAGERFRLAGFVEISAVCTHPDVRGEGLAGELTLNVARAIRAGGNQAFLHVLDTNENAIRLYQKLGFVIRREIDVVFAQWHGKAWERPTPGMLSGD